MESWIKVILFSGSIYYLIQFYEFREAKVWLALHIDKEEIMLIKIYKVWRLTVIITD